MQKSILDEYGVYPMYGREIGNCKELGLEVDKIYYAKKDGICIKQLVNQLGAKDIPVYLDQKHVGHVLGLATPVQRLCQDQKHVGHVLEHKNIDGILFAETPVESVLELAAMYKVQGIVEKGNYIGAEYDLILTDPVLHSVHFVEKKRHRVPFDK